MQGRIPLKIRLETGDPPWETGNSLGCPGAVRGKFYLVIQDVHCHQYSVEHTDSRHSHLLMLFKTDILTQTENRGLSPIILYCGRTLPGHRVGRSASPGTFLAGLAGILGPRPAKSNPRLTFID